MKIHLLGVLNGFFIQSHLSRDLKHVVAIDHDCFLLIYNLTSFGSIMARIRHNGPELK